MGSRLGSADGWAAGSVLTRGAVSVPAFTGLLAGAPLSLGDVLLKNLLPVILGNIVSGALIVGAGLSYAHGRLGEL